MIIGDDIIKKGNVFYMLTDTSPGNNIPAGTGWVNKVYKFINGST